MIALRRLALGGFVLAAAATAFVLSRETEPSSVGGARSQAVAHLRAIDIDVDDIARGGLVRVEDLTEALPPLGAEARARQTAEGFKPRSGSTPWPLAAPLDWAADPFDDVNWRFQLNAWRMNAPLFAAWRDGDEAAFSEALAWALDWRAFETAHPGANRFAWDDMATGKRAEQIAVLISGVRERASRADADQRAKLASLADWHVRALRTPAFRTDHNNHGLFQVHGLMALCRAAPDLAACDGAEAEAQARFEQLLDQQFAADGGHKEHSPAYHLNAVQWFERMTRTSWYGDVADDRLARARALSPWFVRPDDRIVPIGASFGRAPGERMTLASDPVCAGSRNASICLRTFAAPASGYAFAATDPGVAPDRQAHLVLAAAHHSHTHKHADHLTFEWFDLGRPILTEGGKGGYDAGDVRDYAVSTRAHNTIEIDGADFAVGPNPFGSGVRDAGLDADGARLSAHIAAPEFGVSLARTLLFAPGRYLVIVDDVEGDRERVYTRWLHFSAGLDLEGPDEALRLVDDGAPLFTIEDRNACAVDKAKGRDGARAQGWTTARYGELTPAWAVGFTCRAQAARFVTLVYAAPDDRAAALDRLTQFDAGSGEGAKVEAP